MKAQSHPLAFALCGFALALGLGGCVSGPRYEYARQPDSPSISGSENYLGDFVGIPPSAQLEQIDGLPITGMKWSANSAEYLSPGKHSVGVAAYSKVFELPPVFFCYKLAVEENFAANHKYRFTSTSTSGSSFDVTLWDETGGSEDRVSVGEWKGIGQEIGDDGPDSVSFDYTYDGGTDHTRPPLDRGEHPAHSGGPPSIPHNPRPSPGGHGGGGGGRSGGGGGGGHRK